MAIYSWYPASQHDRPAFRALAHKQRGGGSDLVCETDLCRSQPAAKEIRLPAQISERDQTTDANRNTHGSISKRAPMTIVNNHGYVCAVLRLKS